MSTDLDRSKATAALVVIAGAYALFGPVARELSVYCAVFQQVYLRLLLAVILVLPFIKPKGGLRLSLGLPRREWAILTLRAVAGYVVGVGLFTHAVSLTEIANVAFIAALPLTAVFGVILFREKVTVPRVVGVLLATFGLLLIAAKDLSNPLSWGAGEMYAFLSCIGFSFALISRKYHAPGVDNRALSTGIMVVGFIVTFLASIAAGEPLAVPLSVNLLFLLLTAAVLVASITVLQNYAFVHVSGTTSGAILASEGFFALLFGWILFGELPGSIQILGGSLIVLGSLAVLLERKSAAR